MPSFNPSLKRSVHALISDPTYLPLKRHEIARSLQLSTPERQDLRQVLRDLEAEGLAVCLRKNRWGVPEAGDLVSGILRVTSHGYAFLVPDGEGLDDVYIPRDALGVGLHLDRVQVRRHRLPARRRREGPGRDGEERSEGTVERVLERRTKTLVGLLRKTPHYIYVIPDSPNIHIDIRVEPGGGVPCPSENHKVLVELLPWEHPGELLRGRLVEDLGPADAAGVDMLSILREHNLSEEFEGDCLKEAKAQHALAAKTLPGAADRRDLRSWLTFTIDPVDAKDFDDAVSLTTRPDGRYELGVHIADVAAFVEEGSAIDNEARFRGTSTYLVDRVITMLPRELTTEVCSLLPEQDRASHSVVLVLSSKGDVEAVETFPSMIHSAARLSYDEVQALFDGTAEGGAMDAKVVESLKHMRGLAAVLRKKRFENGAIDIDVPEVRCILNESGQAREIVLRGSHEAYHLIEEFMLLANRAVAEKIHTADVPGVYRVHLDPDDEQWGQMQTGLMALGLDRPVFDRASMNAVLHQVVGKPVSYAASLMILRNLKRAEYTSEQAPHFGLGFDFYTHFTSPIRRYPDLLTHRILKALESGAPPPYSVSGLGEMARHCNEAERNADEAERESLDVKRVEYYQRMLQSGKARPCKALITAIVPKGLIVEVASTLQRGLVPFSSMTEDHYRVSPDRTSAVGKRTRTTWHLGTVVEVELTRVDSYRRLVDFRLVRPRKAVAGPVKNRKDRGKKAKRHK